MDDPDFISAQNLARRLNVKTGTLARWRWESRHGRLRGPQGWITFSETDVRYPLREVEAYLDRCREQRLPPTRQLFGR